MLFYPFLHTSSVDLAKCRGSVNMHFFFLLHTHKYTHTQIYTQFFFIMTLERGRGKHCMCHTHLHPSILERKCNRWVSLEVLRCITKRSLGCWIFSRGISFGFKVKQAVDHRCTFLPGIRSRKCFHVDSQVNITTGQSLSFQGES